MNTDDLMYGDKVELANGDICVFVCRIVGGHGTIIELMTAELVLINVVDGEEHNINDYHDDLTHCEDARFDVVGYAD